ncbi:MAG: zinc transporter ZupT [Deltaproteobacteria bacterium]|nr:zinc transporter ZupT [Deltaproteobacteria bacterium]
MEGNIQTAFLLTLFAGLSTGLGSLIVLIARRPTLRLLSFGLGFSGGVMVFVSLAELLPQSQKLLAEAVGAKGGDWVAYGFFFGGILVSALIDALVPQPENPHHVVAVKDLARAQESSAGARRGLPEMSESQAKALARVGLLTAIVIAIHNFPEGMATLVSALSDPSLGFSVAVAVAIHNIPEGISVAVLVLFATGSRGKAFVWSFASGLAEPIGALLIWGLLMPFINDLVVGGMLAAVGGIMVFISFDELLPTAREYGRGHLEIGGIVLGMAVMAVSLALF